MYWEFGEDLIASFHLEWKDEDGRYRSMPLHGPSVMTYKNVGNNTVALSIGGSITTELLVDGSIILKGTKFVKMSEKQIQDCIDVLVAKELNARYPDPSVSR